MRKLMIGAAVVAIAATVSGCGGGSGGQLSKDEYEAKVTSAGKELAASFESISTEAQSISGDITSLDDAKDAFAKLGDVVGTGETNLRDFADELESLSPPDDAKEGNQKLVDGFRKMADSFGGLRSALEDGSLKDMAALAGELQNVTSSEGGKLVQEGIDALEELGYTFDTDS
ncbi:MAG: hypothetical protein U0R50_04935 [Gaiellales bacterium]